MLSSPAVAGDLAAGTLVAVPVRKLALDRRLTAIRPWGRPPDGAAAALLRRASTRTERRR